MDNHKTDEYYIQKALENIYKIISYSNNISYEQFANDMRLQDAIMFRLIQMVEQINHLSFEYKVSHPNVKWGLISGFRNGIVHEYGRTDYSKVFAIINCDIFELKSELER